MQKTFKSRLKSIILLLILGFIILFLFRMAYGFSTTPNHPTVQTSSFGNISNVRNNYASKKYENKITEASASTVQIDQKYEKIASIKTTSLKYEKEEKMARKEIGNYNSLIQFEQKSGNKGYRKLNLVIGVPPENFDSLYSQLIKIGTVQTKQITKKDKTNEYKELNAKKQSLEKIRASLIELKSKGGKIAEYMDLENRVLEIETQLQNLGVSLGDFDEENEFCTVQFSLAEGRETKISFLHRVKVALEWTVPIYLGIMSTLFFLSLFAYLLLIIIGKLKIIERMVNRKE